MAAPGFFTEGRLPAEHLDVAPDGSLVRLLAGLPRGGMAHFELAAGEVSRAVRHRTVEEIWFVLSDSGRMWRQDERDVREVDLLPGVALTIPVGTAFQFRTTGRDALAVLGVTMPPWPGPDEAVLVDGPWVPRLRGAPAPPEPAR